MSAKTSRDLSQDQLEELNALKEVSDAMGNDLSRDDIRNVVRLCEAGANPEGVAMLLREIQAARKSEREMKKL